MEMWQVPRFVWQYPVIPNYVLTERIGHAATYKAKDNVSRLVYATVGSRAVVVEFDADCNDTLLDPAERPQGGSLRLRPLPPVDPQMADAIVQALNRFLITGHPNGRVAVGVGPTTLALTRITGQSVWNRAHIQRQGGGLFLVDRKGVYAAACGSPSGTAPSCGSIAQGTWIYMADAFVYSLFDGYVLTTAIPPSLPTDESVVANLAFTARDCIQRPVLDTYSETVTLQRYAIGIVVEKIPVGDSIYDDGAKPESDPGSPGWFRIRLHAVPQGLSDVGQSALTVALNRFLKQGFSNSTCSFQANFAQNTTALNVPGYEKQTPANVWKSAYVGLDQGHYYLAGLPSPDNPCVAMPSKYAWGANLLNLEWGDFRLFLGHKGSLALRRFWVNDGSQAPTDAEVLACANVSPNHSYADGSDWDDASHPTGWHPFASTMGFPLYIVPETYGSDVSMVTTDDPVFIEDGFYVATKITFNADGPIYTPAAIERAVSLGWGLYFEATPAGFKDPEVKVPMIKYWDTITQTDQGSVLQKTAYIGAYQPKWTLPPCMSGKTPVTGFSQSWLTLDLWKKGRVIARHNDSIDMEVFIPLLTQLPDIPDGEDVAHALEWVPYQDSGKGPLCVTGIKMGDNATLASGVVMGASPAEQGDDLGACAASKQRYYMHKYGKSSDAGALAACKADPDRKGPCIQAADILGDDVVAPKIQVDNTCGALPESVVSTSAIVWAVVAIILLVLASILRHRSSR